MAFLQVGCQAFQEIGPVMVIPEDRLSFNPSGYYVVKCPRCIDAGSARHEIPFSETYKLMYVPYFLPKRTEIDTRALFFRMSPSEIRIKKGAGIKEQEVYLGRCLQKPASFQDVAK